ncbi:MAG: DUF2325 domain-containing protein [Pseudomonadota bacterium]
MRVDRPLPFTGDELPRQTTSSRYRIWEIPGKVQCSIVGTCLDRRDVSILIRKSRARVAPGATEYQIHGFLVHEASQPGPVAQLIHKTLDRKYAPQITRVRLTRDLGVLRAYWDDACARGQVSGIYWALLSHRHVTEGLRNAVFGDVHMLSHFMGGLNRGDARQLWAAERRVGELEQRLERVRNQADAKIAERDGRIEDLDREVHQMRACCVRLQPAATTGPVRPTRPGKMARRHEQQARRLAATRARLREQGDELVRLRGQIAKLERLAVCQIGARKPAAPSTSCPLGNCRLLYVGGRPSAVPHLKTGAARLQAELLHHDGGIEHSLQQLPDLVGQADLVFCPIDCVSHGACLLARDLCKRANKPFVPLRSASLSHFRRALDSLPRPTDSNEETAKCSSP